MTHYPTIFLAGFSCLFSQMNINSDPEVVAPVPPELNYSITDKELDRDIVNLHLPEPDSYVATDDELRALYAPGEYDRMMEEFKGL